MAGLSGTLGSDFEEQPVATTSASDKLIANFIDFFIRLDLFQIA
ncbi:hypothetical protein FMO003_32650 [Moritella sp. F3]|nr:hypothetical protein FMO001_09540 [Moritella sp. F1]GIC82985.1 hypothetical protein FMO003_32650 [Moritella sp. F3]